MKQEKSLLAALLAGTVILFGSASAHAQVTIDQNRATNGNVSPGDAPGFPVTISQRGSYKLTGNLVVPAGVPSAILITASEVSLDLNGFTIMGPDTCSGFGASISCTNNGPARGVEAADGVTDVRVHHGSVEGFAQFAFWLNQRSTLDRITSRNNRAYAAVVRADSLVTHSVFERNGTGGVFSEGGIVADTIASGNGTYGIVVYNTADGGLLRNNVATHNGSIGIVSQGGRVAFIDNQANANPQNIAYNPNLNVVLPGNVCNGAPC